MCATPYVVATGDTRPGKDRLHAAGFRRDATQKQWWRAVGFFQKTGMQVYAASFAGREAHGWIWPKLGEKDSLVSDLSS